MFFAVLRSVIRLRVIRLNINGVQEDLSRGFVSPEQ